MRPDLQQSSPDRQTDWVKQAKKWAKTTGLALGAGLVMAIPAGKMEAASAMAQPTNLNQQPQIEQMQAQASATAETATTSTRESQSESISDQAINQIQGLLQNMPQLINLDYEGKSIEQKAQITLENLSRILSIMATLTMVVKIMQSVSYVNSITEKSGRTTYEMVGNLGDSLLWLSQDLGNIFTGPDKFTSSLNIVNHVVDILTTSAIFTKLMLMQKGHSSEDLEVKNLQDAINILKEKLGTEIGKNSKATDILQVIPKLGEALKDMDLEAAKGEFKDLSTQLTSILKDLKPETKQDKIDFLILALYATASITMGGGAAIVMGTIKDTYNTYKIMAAKEDRPEVGTMVDEYVNNAFWSMQNDPSYKIYGILQLLATLSAYGTRGARKVKEWTENNQISDVVKFNMQELRLINQIKTQMSELTEVLTADLDQNPGEENEQNHVVSHTMW
ncbi:MAG: hypothetical protein OHK0017_11360 [Patescibacteria group bacterium]